MLKTLVLSTFFLKNAPNQGNVKNVKIFVLTEKKVLKTREMLKMLKMLKVLGVLKKAKMDPNTQNF